MIDLNHNLTQTYAPWGVFGFEYDPLDQLTQASDPGYPAGGIAPGVTNYSRDERGLIIGQSNSNGLQGRNPHSLTSDQIVLLLREDKRTTGKRTVHLTPDELKFLGRLLMSEMTTAQPGIHATDPNTKRRDETLHRLLVSSHQRPGQNKGGVSSFVPDWRSPLPAFDQSNPQPLIGALHERAFQKKLKAQGASSEGRDAVLRPEESGAILYADMSSGIENHGTPYWSLNKPEPVGSASDLLKSGMDSFSHGVTAKIRHGWYGSDTGGDPDPFTQMYKFGGTVGATPEAVAQLLYPESILGKLGFYSQATESAANIARGTGGPLDVLSVSAVVLHTGVVGKAIKAVPAYTGPFRRLDQYAQVVIGKSDALYKGTPGGVLEPTFRNYPRSVGEYLTPTNIKTGIARSYINTRGLVLGYRGTSLVSENDIFHDTGHLLSDAGRRGYVEAGGDLTAGYSEAVKSHGEWMGYLGGSEVDYAQLHSLFGSDLARAGGPTAARSLLSLTTTPERAFYFATSAGTKGTVYFGLVSESNAIWQSLPGSTEREILARFGIKGFSVYDPLGLAGK